MEVLQRSVAILREQLSFFDQSPVIRVEKEKPAPVAAAPAPSPATPAAAPVSTGLTLDDLGLTTRVLHNLKEEGIESVESLLALSERELKKVPGIGERSLQEIKDILAQHGLEMKP